MVPENKQKRRHKITTLAFKMIPIVHNTLLATPNSNFTVAIANYWAHQTQQPQFLWAQTQILLCWNLSF
jgi:hypothetical protein